jgi:phage terminase large subunit
MTAEAPEQVIHRYRPVGSALQLMHARGAEIVLSGAAGTGKSRACLEKLHAMAMANPGMRGLIARKTAVSLTSTALVTYREIVAAEALASGEVAFYGGSAQEAASYRYGNGSTLTIGGMDKASRIMSSEYDAIYVQEATELTEDDWETLTTRLRNGVVSFQQLMADTNPSSPTSWLYQRCQRGQTVMIPCRHEDNPRLYDDGEWTAEGAAYLAILEALTGVRYLRLRKGVWAAAEGLVFDGFDPAVHLHKHIANPPADWVRYLAVDFGYRNPFCCQWYARDNDGRLYMYREIYMTGRLVEDHARQILELIRKGDGHQPDQMPREVICDHDAEDRATLERHLGLSTVAAHKAVSEGIQAVQSRLKVDATGKPGLYLCRDALVERDPALEQAHKPLCLQDEILEYAWDMSAVRGGKQGAGDTLKEQPFKENDHSCDALRYAVAAIDLVGRPRLRFIR